MASDTFSVLAENPRCFRYRGRPFKILTSAEHYGAVLNGDFYFRVYLDEMRRTGQNMTRVFTFYRETPESIVGPGAMNTLAPRPEAAILPWERAADAGPAADGLPRFDLERWNPAYFARLERYIAECAHHGVVCEVVLFCNPYTQDKYDLFPCSPKSNVNGVGDDLQGHRRFMTLEAQSIVAFQERFVRKVVQALNGFDNLYFEICNEPNLGTGTLEDEAKLLAWHARLAAVIREEEARLPRRHLIAANAQFLVNLGEDDRGRHRRHEDAGYFTNPDIDIVNYHYMSAQEPTEGLAFIYHSNRDPRPGFIWRFMRHRDGFAKPIVFDETFTGIVRSEPERYAITRAEAWETLLSGAAGYDNLDWSFTQADGTGSGAAPIGDGRHLDGRELRSWFAILRDLLGEYDLGALAPALGAAASAPAGYGLSGLDDGMGHYLYYLADERLYRLEACNPQDVEVCLHLPAAEYRVRTLHPKTGATSSLPMTQSKGEIRLHLERVEEDICLLLDRA